MAAAKKTKVTKATQTDIGIEELDTIEFVKFPRKMTDAVRVVQSDGLNFAYLRDDDIGPIVAASDSVVTWGSVVTLDGEGSRRVRILAHAAQKLGLINASVLLAVVDRITDSELAWSRKQAAEEFVRGAEVLGMSLTKPQQRKLDKLAQETLTMGSLICSMFGHSIPGRHGSKLPILHASGSGVQGPSGMEMAVVSCLCPRCSDLFEVCRVWVPSAAPLSDMIDRVDDLERKLSLAESTIRYIGKHAPPEGRCRRWAVHMHFIASKYFEGGSLPDTEPRQGSDQASAQET